MKKLIIINQKSTSSEIYHIHEFYKKIEATLNKLIYLKND